jgi:hypothetical protein
MQHGKNNKLDLAPWGYAPGMSLFYCTDCGSPDPEQGHAHSTRCIRHALAQRALIIPVDVVLIIPPVAPECKSNRKLKLTIFASMLITFTLGIAFLG